MASTGLYRVADWSQIRSVEHFGCGDSGECCTDVVGDGVAVYGLKARTFVPGHAAYGPFGDHLSGHGNPESHPRASKVESSQILQVGEHEFIFCGEKG